MLGGRQRADVGEKKKEVSEQVGHGGRKTLSVSVGLMLKGQPDLSMMGWPDWVIGMWRPVAPRFQCALESLTWRACSDLLQSF